MLVGYTFLITYYGDIFGRHIMRDTFSETYEYVGDIGDKLWRTYCGRHITRDILLYRRLVRGDIFRGIYYGGDIF